MHITGQVVILTYHVKQILLLSFVSLTVCLHKVWFFLTFYRVYVIIIIRLKVNEEFFPEYAILHVS